MNQAEKTSVNKAIVDTQTFMAKIREEHGDNFAEAFVTAYNFRIFGTLIMHAIEPQRIDTIIEAMTLTFAGTMHRMQAALGISDEEINMMLPLVDELYEIAMADELNIPRLKIVQTIQ